MAEPIVSLKGLGKSFGTIKALEDISFDIVQGEIFGVIGLSGAGKSTLVRCINFLERPTEGAVYFEGRNMADLTNKELLITRRKMGMIFQSFNLLQQRTALDNIRYPLEIAGVNKKKANARAKELLEIVGMENRAKSYPSQLSGGQQQRIAIARGLATNPKLLLCDEATSALDPATTNEILDLLQDINERFGTTMMIITHEMSVISSLCHRVAILDKSRVAELGNVDKIFTNPKTDVARRLIYPENTNILPTGQRVCRLVFEGNASAQPVVADLVLKFQQKVNIMFADTKDIDGKAFGQMLIQLPDDDQIAEEMIKYIRSVGVHAEEAEL